jgi:hypothetical protein
MLQIRELPHIPSECQPWSSPLAPIPSLRPAWTAASEVRYCRIVALTDDERVVMLREEAPWRLTFPCVGLRSGESPDAGVQRKLLDCAEVSCTHVEPLGTYHGTCFLFGTGAHLAADPAALGPRLVSRVLLPFSQLLQWVDCGGFDTVQALAFGLALVRRAQLGDFTPKLAPPVQID